MDFAYFNVAAWLKETDGLDVWEYTAYHIAVMTFYKNKGKPITFEQVVNEHRTIDTSYCPDVTDVTIAFVLKRFFKRLPDWTWVHPRILKELETYRFRTLRE